MYQHNVATEAEHSHATDDAPVAPTGAAGVGRTGPRTAGGAAVMAVVPVVAAVVAAVPMVAVAVVAAAVVARQYRGDAGAPPDERQGDTTQTQSDHTMAPAD